MDLLLATNNENKVKEIKSILSSKFNNVYTLKDKNIDIDVVEDGKTFFENAYKKAREISLISNMITLSDDSGLEVNALNGAPGVYSARYAGGHEDKANNILLLKNMKDITDRRARFVSCVVIYYPNGEYKYSEGYVDGEILQSEDNFKNGFGYDPLFYSYELKKSFAEATLAEKNTVSHRYRALEKLFKIING